MKSKASGESAAVVLGSSSGSTSEVEVEPDSAIAVGRRIEEVRGRMGRDEFAAEMSVHPNTLGRYERGDRMAETDFVMTLCMKRRVNSDWLLFGTGPRNLQDVVSQHSVLQPMAEYGRADLRKASADEILSQFVLVPFYDIRATAGFGALVEDKEPDSYWAFRRDWLQREVHVPEKRLALVSTAGNSMEPHLHDGDPALIDRGDTELVREGIYVFSLDGHVFVKQLRLVGTSLVIESTNSTDFPTMELNTLREDIKFRIGGRVLGTPCFHRL